MHWQSPNFNATNESGFPGIPDGYRNYDGSFKTYSYDGLWFSSTEVSSQYAYRQELYFGTAGVYCYSTSRTDGFAVRCLKDNWFSANKD